MANAVNINALRMIKIDPTNNVFQAFVTPGDPTSDGFAAGVDSLITIIGGALSGNTYRKTSTGDTDWTLIVNAHPA